MIIDEFNSFIFENNSTMNSPQDTKDTSESDIVNPNISYENPPAADATYDCNGYNR